jgi:preprotein translocase subunit SecF
MAGIRSVGHRLYSGDVSVNFVDNKRRWFIFSGIVVVILIIGFAIRGLNLGIEFTGGAEFQAPAHANQATVSTVRSAVSHSGVGNLGDVDVSKVGSKSIRVQTRSLNTNTEVPKVKDAIASSTGASTSKVTYNLIGPTWGKQVTQRGITAMVVFLGLVSLLLWAYMRNLKMSGAALLALLHDLVVTVGVYALVGFSFTPESLIGMLTILGYSLYDTVVVFDKVRENTRSLTSNATQTYSEAANLAVNQTLVRSINTTVIGVLPVSALLFAGGVILHTGPLKDLSLALFVGMIAGTYSSIFLATPILTMWKEREPDMIRQRKRVAARRERAAGRATAHSGAHAGLQPAAAVAGAGGGQSARIAASDDSTNTGRAPAPQTRPDPDRNPTSGAVDAGESHSGHSATGEAVAAQNSGSDDEEADNDSSRADQRGGSGRRLRYSQVDTSQPSPGTSGPSRPRRGSLNEGGAKRPQPHHESRSRRKK